MKPSTLFLITALLGSGWATIFKGYYDTVEIVNPPTDLKIRTLEGVEIPYRVFQDNGEPIFTKDGFYSSMYQQILKADFKLRSNKDRILIFQYSGKEKKD